MRCVVACWTLGVAMGHVGFENTTEIRVQRNQMQIEVKAALNLTWKFLGDQAPKFDDEQSRAEILPVLEAHAERLLKVTDGGAVMPLREKSVAYNQDGAVDFILTYDRPSVWPVEVKALFFEVLGPLDSGTMTVFDESGGPLPEGAEPLKGRVIVKDQPGLGFSLVAASAVTGVGAETQEPVGLGRYFLLGIEHILTGYDHLLFLFALVLACRSVKPMLLIVTAFTLAHSITLALAALDIVKLPSVWVEAFIALSIVFVGVENVFFKIAPGRRAALTFAFGLIHGMGFAGALKEIGLGSDGHSIIGPLISFNLGVESGQLALVAIVLPILLKLRKRPAFEKWAVPAMSVLVILMGTFWFIERVRG